ncbi:hypothetical protein [Nocardioides sp. B-3]|uniref:hypothetical protein n=1 Tax=Nocardioides sp. B-3 TaxID=2895565 RepID=UPI002152D1B2|nr:hypothetical protein [Nocardioides sp. B-3]UUZ60289.1 hypothetical protein LP418_04990 [Nocardioides sp. B-3]
MNGEGIHVRPVHADPDWDLVDQVVEDMQRILPEADLSSLHVVSRMLQVMRVFERRREKVLKQHGLEAWSFDMLSAIRRCPAQQMRPGDLLEFTPGDLGDHDDRGWTPLSDAT